MKEFFKMMFASLLGFVLFSIVAIFLFVGLIAYMVSSASSDEVVISSQSVLHLTLDQPIVDRAPKSPIFFDLNTMSRQSGLVTILKNIEKAKDDPKIAGIYLELTSIPAGITTISEIRNALIDFKTSGKFIYAYSDNYSQSAYYLATAADKIYLNPEGSLLIKGINAELTFFKGTLEKLDVKVQVIRHGKFKAATEPFFLDKMSPENRQQVSALINGVWDQVIKGISETRHLDGQRINQIADSLAIRTAQNALDYKLVDRVAYKDEFIKEMKKTMGLDEKDKVELVTNEKYARVTDVPSKHETGKDKIAVIYATGNIMSGDGDDQTIGSDGLSKAIKKAREDEAVKAIVLRVNSPGGDALASDVIWREVTLATKSKPVVASFGDVAASGGYYISCGATQIYAEPTTITGSIGVFGLVPNMKGLFNNKLGVTFDNEKTNKNSDYISVTAPLSPYQTQVLQNEIEHIYTTFVSKVADGRKLSPTFVDSIAQGRVWCGTDAKRLGLIDEYGGLDESIKAAAKLAKIEDYRITSLPEQKDLFTQIYDELTGGVKASLLEKELGEDYIYYRTLKELKSMKGVQARLPFHMELN